MRKIFNLDKIKLYYSEDSNLIPNFDSEMSQFFSLHWSDAGGKNFKGEVSLARIREKLKPIEETQIWILDGEVKSFRMIDWYFELFRAFKEKGIPKKLLEPKEVSFLSPNGPFKKIKLIDTLNAETFELFVYMELLSQKIPERKFRVRSHSMVLIGAENQNFVANIRHITFDGLLMSAHEQYIPILNHAELNLYITIDKWDNYMMGKTDQDPFFSFIQKDALVVEGSKVEICRSYHHLLSQEIYFFIPYKAMSTRTLEKRMQDFLNSQESLIKKVA